MLVEVEVVSMQMERRQVPNPKAAEEPMECPLSLRYMSHNLPRRDH